MGSQTSKFSKTVVGNETHNSARNVLEKIVLETKGNIKGKANLYKDKLKGNLSKAKFYQPLLVEAGVKKDVPSNLCDLDYIFHTNASDKNSEDRHPCHMRDRNRFSNEGEAECGSDKIRDNGERSAGGACAPYRRRHLCNYNLEYINENNTKTTDDLLGNILVTAKYEGASIVEKHPNRGSSEVCTALARSFADIGDIIRGRDMFLGNNKEKEKIENNLKDIFKNIQQNNKKLKDLTDKHIREYWWALNREDVWKALTCSADGSEDYFIQSEDGTKSFSDRKCGHYENNILTNLDYVPQFLRWFNEWAEEFCRIRKIKLGKVKNACRGEKDEKDCSREGYDCKRTDLKKNEIFMDLECPNCEKACTSYKEWIENKQKEFKKQKKKYEKEIENNQSNNDRIYDKKFYTNLNVKYPSVSNFVETLKEGAYCTNGIIESKIDFNKQYDTFSHSQYCKPCPIFNLKCANGKCNSLDDITCTYVKGFPNRITDKNNDAFVIDILLNDNKIKKLSHDLKDVFNECDLFKRIRKQNWNCKYKCNLDVCEQKNYNNEMDDERFVSIDVLIKRWLKYFLNDYNQIKEKLNRCINNEKKKEFLCIKGCYKNCDCVEKWITKKREEWQNIKDRYIKQYISKDEVFSSKLKSFLKQGLFPKYIENALDPDETLDKMKESSVCNVPNKLNGTSCKNNDVITILLNRLKEKIKTCKSQHEENKNNNSCKTSPPPLPRRRHQGRRRVVRSVRIRRPRQVVKNDRGLLVGEEEEEEADNGGDQEVKKEEKEEEETPEEEAEVERPGPPVTPVPELPQPPATTTPGVKPPCDIVKEHFKDKHDNTGGIEKCYPKYYPRKIDYPGWNCTNETLVSGKGECMPPRRQKLCLINLQHLTEKTSDDLRKAFIKCAAVETCFLWHKYKEDKKNENPSKNLDEVVQKQLKDGTIPEEFKRQMFYTFGDYRDIFFDTDISKKQGPVKDAKNKIDELFPTTDPKNKTKRQEWWNEHKEAIWEGMLCALSYDTNEKTFKKEIHTNLIDAKNNNTYANVKFSGNQSTLEEFAKRPQFLRWFTEWGEDFCKKRKEKVDKLVGECNSCTISDSTGGDGGTKTCQTDSTGCTKCREECKKYKEWLETWKGHYDKQSKKYFNDKESKTFQSTSAEVDVNSSKHAYEYLKKVLPKNCPNGSCSCMDAESKDTPNKTNADDDTHNANMPASLDNEPQELEGKCSCTPPPPPKAQPGGAGRSLGPRSKEDDEDKGEVEEKEETPAAEVQDGP
ncbi:hypothetical protein PFFCH_01576, partial [Plasmodium falciparum FCH/4]